MDGSKSGKKQKVTMDSDVFSLFGHKIPAKDGLRADGTGGQKPRSVTQKKELRQEGTSKSTRPICDKEREALETLETIFDKRSYLKLIALPSIPKQETMHPSIRRMDFECPQDKINEIDSCLEDEELSQLLAEAEYAKIDVFITCSPKLLEKRTELKDKDVVNVEIMRPSEYLDYLK